MAEKVLFTQICAEAKAKGVGRREFALVEAAQYGAIASEPDGSVVVSFEDFPTATFPAEKGLEAESDSDIVDVKAAEVIVKHAIIEAKRLAKVQSHDTQSMVA